MRTRTCFAAALAAALLPLTASAEDDARILVSGKLDASQSHEFSCSLVNKNEEGDVDVELRLKDANGDTAVDPSTFLPAALVTTLAPGEAAMLVLPADFVGVTSVYCWAEVPLEATVFGTFLVRDAEGHATAATSLAEDVAGAARALKEKLDEIHEKIDMLEPPPPPPTVRGFKSCEKKTLFPSKTFEQSVSCPAETVATGGGCEAFISGSSDTFYHTYRDGFIQPANAEDPPTEWRCTWRNNSIFKRTSDLCVEVICLDSGTD